MSQKVSKTEIAYNMSRRIGAGLVQCAGCPADEPGVDPARHDGLCERHYFDTLDTMGASLHLPCEEW